MIKVGIVGCGGMGKVHFSAYSKMEECAVVAACDFNKENIPKEWNIPLYTSLSDMVNFQEIDVVDVCTPTFTHHDIVIEALSFGKNVVCEKPIALSKKDAAEMYSMAEKKQVHLYIGQVLRFFDTYQYLDKLVKSNKYGRVMDAYFTRLSACPNWCGTSWMFDKSKSGQVLYDLHIHDLDFIVSTLGVPETYSYTKCTRAGESYSDLYRICYELPDKLHVCAEASWYHAPYKWNANYRVCFENAVVESSDEIVYEYPFDGETIISDFTSKAAIHTGINVPDTDAYSVELKHFIRCIEKKIDSDIVLKDHVLAVMDLLERMSKSDD